MSLKSENVDADCDVEDLDEELEVDAVLEYDPLRAGAACPSEQPSYLHANLNQPDASGAQSIGPQDDLDAFFKFITLTVRKLPPPLVLEAKRQIFALVTDLEIKALK